MEDKSELTDKNSCACYFLEPGKDKQALDKVKSLGYDRIINLTNEGISLKKGDVILIIKNDASIHPNPDDHRFKDTCREMKDLLAPAGISDIQNIPRYKLNDFLIQEKKDMDILNDNFLSDIPINRRTEAVCMKALNDHPGNMEDIPDYLFTEKRIERILDMNYHFIADLPKEKLNEEICLNAIGKNSSVFLHMPQEVKTEKVCIAAYEQARMETDDSAYLKSIVRAIPHGKVCMDLLNKYAYSSLGEFDIILSSASKNIMNQEIAEQAVKLQEYAILTIPEKLISENMVYRAIEADASLLFIVPDRYKTREMCQQAIQEVAEDKGKHLIFSSVPYPELIMAALHSEEYKDCQILDIVTTIPKEVMNKRIAIEAVMRDANCLPHIPFGLKDESICLLAIENAKELTPLYAIPGDSMTEKVCTELVRKFPEAIRQLLPEDKKTPELCLLAVKQDESLQKYVPESIVNDPKLNMYRFGMLVEEQISLNFTQVKDLYEGKKVEIDYTEPTNQIPRKVQVEYNTQRESLNYYDSVRDTKSTENKQQNTISDKGKGLKM